MRDSEPDFGALRVMFLAKRLGWGGMTRSMCNSAMELVRQGHSVTVYTIEGKAIRHHAPVLKAAGVEVVMVDRIRRRDLLREVSARQIDAVRLFTGTFPPNTTVVRRAAMLGVPLVESIHQMSVRPVRLTHRIGYRLMRRPWYRAVVLSRGMYDESLRRLPSLKSVLRQLPFGMVIPAAGLEPRGDQTLRICTITRLDEEHKDTTTLLEAAALLPKEIAWRLVIVGGGPDEDRLRRLACERGIDDRIEWLGMIDDPIRVLRGCDLFVLSTKYEGFGRVNIEAAAVGLAVIASDALGCLDSVDDGVNGVIVPKESPPALAASMARLLTDDDERARLAANGPAHARRFTPAVHARAFVELVRECYAERAAGNAKAGQRA